MAVDNAHAADDDRSRDLYMKDPVQLLAADDGRFAPRAINAQIAFDIEVAAAIVVFARADQLQGIDARGQQNAVMAIAGRAGVHRRAGVGGLDGLAQGAVAVGGQVVVGGGDRDLRGAGGCQQAKGEDRGQEQAWQGFGESGRCVGHGANHGASPLGKDKRV